MTIFIAVILSFGAGLAIGAIVGYGVMREETCWRCGGRPIAPPVSSEPRWGLRDH